jgi:N-acetylglucosamine-6-phosphate deacetylase
VKLKSARPHLYKNCRLAFPDTIVEGALLTEADAISAIWIGEQPQNLPKRTRIVDCHNLILSPGLVDIHNHGAVTHDFVAANARGNILALRYHAAHGVTSMLPTVMTETPEQMAAALKMLADQQAAAELYPNYRGIHVEGPYFNPEKRGAHKLDCLRDPVPAEYERFWKLSRGQIRIFTHAPERRGSLEFCRFFHERGCVPTIGHTKATMLQIRRAAAYGARHFVHANNAIDWPARQPRPEGWLGSELMGMGTLLTHSAFTGEIISDGYHVPVEMIRLILAACSTDRIAIVSDACSATGCGPGEYSMGGVKVILKPKRLALTDGNLIQGVRPLGGSATPQLAMVRNYVDWGFGLTAPLKMATAVPARIIGEAKKGVLRVGGDADLILIDDQVSLRATVIGGNVVHGALPD